jgi:predicted Zn-dependent protease with MMP-like domain
MSTSLQRPDGWIAPDLAGFEAMALRAYDDLPEAFRSVVGRLVVHVEEFASEEVLDEMDIDDPLDLTGLYQGVSLIHDSPSHPVPEPSRVFLYRMPIVYEWALRGDVTLGELIAHVLVHEVAHHFGWSDAEIDALLEGE